MTPWANHTIILGLTLPLKLLIILLDPLGDDPTFLLKIGDLFVGLLDDPLPDLDLFSLPREVHRFLTHR